MTPRVALALAAALVACTPEPLPARRVVAPQPLTLRAPEEVVVDVAANGDALVGRPLPLPENSDADRTLTVRWLTRAGSRPWRMRDTPVIEARYVPRSAALLVLTTDHTLVRLDAPEAAPVTLDREVHGPLSLDAAGRRVVYTRGDPPALEVVRAEVATGVTTPLAPGLAPSWCPALSPDGREVLVVASPEGTPSFYRLREGSPSARWNLPSDTPLPTGPTAPVIFGDAVVYESDGALRTLGLDGALRGSLAGVGLPVYVPGAPTLLTQDARHRLTLAAPRDLEVTR